MNKHVHRLVFDRRRGMCVPAGEHTRSAGKASGTGEHGARRRPGGLPGDLAGAALAAVLAYGPPGAWAADRPSLSTLIPRSGEVTAARATAGRPMANLPQRLRDFSGATPGNPVDVNRFRIDTTDPKTMRIDQFDQRVIINWDSFDIGQGYTVRFVQPTGGAALNNIWDNQASIILGRIQANGEVLLQNQNGILFGPTARVDTQRFVATALRLADETFLKGLRSAQGGSTPTFGGTDQEDKGFVSVERGAEIKALAGGDVILVAPRVLNEGRIETPSGQTVMAAGQKVYLFSSTDAAQRGLWVTVDAFDPALTATQAGVNTVEQARAGTYAVRDGETVVGDATGTAGLEQRINEVVADKGRINLVGMVVRQNGKLSATTAVRGENGAIMLHAVASTALNADTAVHGALGTLEIGADGVTRVTPADSSATQKDAETFYRSTVDLLGKDIRIGRNALVEAVSGNLSVMAAATAQHPLFTGEGVATGDASLFIDQGARLSVAGLRDVVLPMSRNQLSLNLYQNELADTPVQRGGTLYRNQVYFDARKPVAVANVKGAYNLIERTARELSVRGGNLRLEVDGALVVADGVKLDVSGGSKRYDAGEVYSSVLGTGKGTAVPIEQARADVRYDRLINPGQLRGETSAGADGTLLAAAPQARQSGYVEGGDAGWLSLKGDTIYLGADIQGDAVVGPLQWRGDPTGTVVSATDASRQLNTRLSTELGRSLTLMGSPHLYASLRPLGARVDIENTQGGMRLVADTEARMPSLPALDEGASSSWLAEFANETQVSARKLQASGASAVALKATQTAAVPHDVVVEADVKLDLGASGSFLAASQGAGHVHVAGQIRAAGGQIAVEAGQARTNVTGEGNATGAGTGSVTVASTAVLDVSGGAGPSGAQADGGQISVKAGQSVAIESGALLDVSAAMVRSTSQGRIKGKAGAIQVQVNTTVPAGVPEDSVIGSLRLGGTLRGHDFSAGGSLTLGGMRALWIGDGPVDSNLADPLGMALAPAFFSEGGFGRITLQTKGDITVAQGTRIAPRLVNLVEMRGGTPARQVGAVTGGSGLLNELGLAVLDEALRKPVSITLDASSLRADVASLERPTGLNLGGRVTVAEGAVIDAGLGGSITLRGSHRVDLYGALVARGGRVSVGLGTDANLHRVGSSPTNATELDPVGYLADQGVALHDGSRIDVSGAARVRTVAAGSQQRVVGDVLGGGTVQLNPDAQRGGVWMDAGATIDLSGAQADVQIGTSRTPTRLSAGAGELQVSSLYGFYLGGTLLAHRPDDSVAGGRFEARTLAGSIKDFLLQDGVTPGTVFPVDSLDQVGRIRLVATADQVAGDAAGRVFGESQVSAEQLLKGGFDRIGLSASERIVLGNGASLKGAPSVMPGSVALRAVVLDAPVIAAEGGSSTPNRVDVEAQYVSVGSSRSADPALGMRSAGAATTGSATLDIHAGLIEWYGSHALQGLSRTDLRATLGADGSEGRQDGEIRLIGLGDGAARPEARLAFAGDLNLTAGNLYASTLTAARIEGNADARLATFNPRGGSRSAAPLSALGSLTLNAGTVRHGGTIDQPFGDIALTGARVSLLDGSRLSVSGAGLTVPVGFTLNGQTWLYGTNLAGVTSSTEAKAVLDLVDLHKDVRIESPDLQVAPTSMVQAQAGGDLLAWSFVQGVGGTTDTFNRPGVYAIVPGYRHDFAPYDTQTALAAGLNGQPLQAGEQVRITSANGVLPVGTYTLLPARYGVLPGAVLVSATQLDVSQPLARGQQQADGSVLVSGYRTAVGTGIRGGNRPDLALVLEPAATVGAQSRVDRVSIQDFLREEPVSRPAEGGRVSLLSDKGFHWQAQYQLQGGELDLSMGQALVVARGPATGLPLEEDEVRVSAEALSATQADSILLGGRRTQVQGEAVVTTLADRIRFEGDVDGGELIAVARQHIDIGPSVSLTVDAARHATTDTPRVVRIDGEGAALAVSRDLGLDLQRDLSAQVPGAAPLGTVTVRAGHGAPASLAAANVVLDAADRLEMAPGIDLRSRALALAARDIVVGAESPSDRGALGIEGRLLDQVNQSERLQLRSYGGLTLAQDVILGSAATQRLTLDAPSLQGQGGEMQVRAQNVTLRNTTGRSASPEVTGAGTLNVAADPTWSDARTGGLTIGQGAVRLAVDAARLSSQGDIVFDGPAGTSHALTAQGDLTLSAARVTATSGTTHAADAGGVLSVTSTQGGRTLGEHVGLGAALQLSGQRVVQAGRVELASGRVTLEGRGAAGRTDTVVMAAGSTTSAAGAVLQAGQQWAVSTAGGQVTARALEGDVHVGGTIDVSAGGVAVRDAAGRVTGWQAASASDSAKAAGGIILSAATAAGTLHLADSARLIGRAAPAAQAGTLQVDAGRLRADDGGQITASAARSALDRLADLANQGGLHGAFSARVRGTEAQKLDTLLKAARVQLTVDQASLTLGGHAHVDAAAPQGGLVQLAAQGLTLEDQARITAGSTRQGAAGGDVLLSAVGGSRTERVVDPDTGEVMEQTLPVAGVLSLQAGAQVDAGTGRIVLRAERDDDATLLAVYDAMARAESDPSGADPRMEADALVNALRMTPVAATLTAGEVLVEAARVYARNEAGEAYTGLRSGGSSGTMLGQRDLSTQAGEFMAHRDILMRSLGLKGQASLRAGIELRGAGDLTIAQDWNLWNAARTGEDPVAPFMLTVRAGGHLRVQGSLSDGFTSAAATGVIASGPAASMRLVAGADLGSADLLAVGSAGTAGDLTVAGGKLVRTTAGSIELAAARDVVLAPGSGATPTQGLVYVAGQPATLSPEQVSLAPDIAALGFTDGGGRLAVHAGRDIQSAAPVQLPGNWLLHAAVADGDGGVGAGAWASYLPAFKQGLGSFGGGGVQVSAGRDIVNLGVVAPTSGRHVQTWETDADGMPVLQGVRLDVRNGGDLTVQAGRDILGGVFLLGRGEGRLEAGGAMTRGSNLKADVPAQGAILALMDGRWTLQARTGIELAALYNPTALSSPSTTRVPAENAASFFTYGAQSGLHASTASGDVVWDAQRTFSSFDAVVGTATRPTAVQGYFNYLHSSSQLMPSADRLTRALAVSNRLAQVAPPTVHLSSGTGDVRLLTADPYALWLFPSATGNLSLYAGGDMVLRGGARGIVMLEGDPARWPSPSRPALETGWTDGVQATLRPAELGLAGDNRRLSVDTLYASTLHQDDALPATLYAVGDLSSNTRLTLPKPARIEAEGDVVDLSYAGQHFHRTDVTLIRAGGDLIGRNNIPTDRDSGMIQLAGPGELQVEAGRHIDLRTSGGIQTIGNLPGSYYGISAFNVGNAALPDEGASIRVRAGMAKTVDVDAFAERHLAGHLDAQAALVSHVRQVLALTPQQLPELDYAGALALYKGFSRDNQVRFAQAVLDRAFVARYVMAGQPYAAAWQDRARSQGVDATDWQGAAFQQFKDEILLSEVRRLGQQAVELADSTDPVENQRRKALRDALWREVDAATSLAGLGAGFVFDGDINLASSKVHTLADGGLGSGGIDLFAPGGQVLVGYSSATDTDRAKAATRGLVTYRGGSIRSFSDGDFQVNTQKAFVVGEGDLMLYTRQGAIDSGRGSNTDVTVPAPVPVVDPSTGAVVFRSPAVTTGSGIGLLKQRDGTSQGTVELFAPVGGVLALDTYIRNESGGDIRVAGPVKGGDNLKGNVKGAPPVVSRPAVRVNTPLPADATAGAAQLAEASQAGRRKEANGIVTVELLSLGDGSSVPACAADDPGCTR